MIRDRLFDRKLEKIPKGKRIGATPFDAPFAVDPLEVPHEVHPKVPARRNRRAALVGIVRLAQLLDKRVEPELPQSLLEAIVEGMTT